MFPIYNISSSGPFTILKNFTYNIISRHIPKFILRLVNQSTKGNLWAVLKIKLLSFESEVH